MEVAVIVEVRHQKVIERCWRMLKLLRVGEMATGGEETPPLRLLWLKYLSEAREGLTNTPASTLSTKEELFIKRRCVVARTPRPDRQPNGFCLTNFGPPSFFRGDHPLVAL